MTIRPVSTALGLFVALLCCLSIYAQSGRRQTKPPAVAPVPTPTPEPSPQPTPKKDENQLTILVVPGDQGASDFYPLSFTEAATAGCADRLEKGSSATVDLSRQRMMRGEAIAKAKAGKSYVVLMSLIEDRMSATSSSGRIELEVDYVVFAPGTAKVMASGRTYEHSRRHGPLVVGPRGSTVNLPSYREQLLRHAGEEAGERILKALHLDRLPTPPVK
jgi:hypothetical protein